MQAVCKRLCQKGTIPLPRSSHAMTTVDKMLYLFSGELLPRVPIDAHLFCYDIQKETWSQLHAVGSRPNGRIAPTLCSVGSCLYLFGGRVGQEMGAGAMNDLHCYNTENNMWTEVITNGKSPPHRSYHAMTTDGNKLFVFGGCGTDGRLNDLYSFGLKSKTWEQLPTNENIAPRGGSSITVINNELYVISGFKGEATKDVYKLNLSTLTWTEVVMGGEMCARSVFGLTTVGTKIYLFGGEVSTFTHGHEDAGVFSNELFCWDTTGPDEWKIVSVVGDTPTPRGWFACAGISNAMMVLHGGLDSANSRLDDFFLIENPQ